MKTPTPLLLCFKVSMRFGFRQIWHFGLICPLKMVQIGVWVSQNIVYIGALHWF